MHVSKCLFQTDYVSIFSLSYNEFDGWRPTLAGIGALTLHEL